MDKRRAKLVYNDIMNHKENYNQSYFHTTIGDPRTNSCKTQHCVAGFAEYRARRIKLGSKKDKEIASDYPQDSSFYEGAKYLRLKPSEAEYLFSAVRSWREVRTVLTKGKFPEHIELQARIQPVII